MQEKDISQNDRDRERQSKAAVHSETVCLLIENPHHQVPERDLTLPMPEGRGFLLPAV